MDAARADALLSLNILESQAEWNARSGTDRGNFQYAQAQMLIRYLNETYSVNTPIELIRAIGLGSSVAGAVANVLGVQYFDFERRFTQWLATYEDPRRKEVREFVAVLSGIEDSWRSIADRRSVKVRKQIALIQRVSAQQQFVTDNRALLDQLLSVSPPNQLQSLYQDTREWLEALDRWLSLELESFNTNDTRKLDQANDMISEVNSRGFLVSREINSTQIIYGLED